MSIKIETGMIFPLNRLPDFQIAAHTHIVNVLRTDVKMMLDQAKGMHNGEFAQYARGIERHTKEQCECGFNFFFQNKFVYAYYWGNPILTYTGSNLEWVRELSYWNHTDKPEEISQEEWDRRACKWMKILSHEDNSWNRHLSWKVIDGFEVHKIMQSLVRKGNGHVQNALSR